MQKGSGGESSWDEKSFSRRLVDSATAAVERLRRRIEERQSAREVKRQTIGRKLFH